MLRNRLIVAALFISIVVIGLDQGGLIFFALVALIILLAGYEFFWLMRQGGYHPLIWVGYPLIALFLLQTYLKQDWTRQLLIGALLITLVIATFRRSEGWLVGWALTFVGVLYIGGLGSYFILMRALPAMHDLPDGKAWGAMAAMTTWAMDTAAYTVGVHWGRHRFFPEVSPKKTLEGAIGGWVMAIIAMLVLGTVSNVPLIHSIALGVGIGLSGTFGDLAESVIKRQVGAKDSGGILLGHGGVLDRIDSILFVAVFVYYYVRIFLGG